MSGNVRRLRNGYGGSVAKESNFERGGRLVDGLLAEDRIQSTEQVLLVAVIDTLRAVVEELSETRHELTQMRQEVAAVPTLTAELRELRERLGLAA